MDTGIVQVLRVDVEIAEDGRFKGAWVTTANVEEPTKLSTMEFPSICDAFDAVLYNLMHAKVQSLAFADNIKQAGNA